MAEPNVAAEAPAGGGPQAPRSSTDDPRVFAPSEQEMLALMRAWISREPTARRWLAALHHRCERDGEGYASAQLWQIKKELANRRVLERVVDDIPGWVSFDPDTLLRAVLHAAERLASGSR